MTSKAPFFVLVIFTILTSCITNDSEEHANGTADHTHDADGSYVATDTLAKHVVARTLFSPEYLQLATNIEVIPDITNASDRVGVLTHEGIFGPFLFAEDIRAFFIELKPGMFLSEHPHPSESIVYTISGKWVLCSERKRQVMEPGSLFHFGSNMPTGWEAPFAEGALLLVVKSKEDGEAFEPYMKGLFEMQETLDKERSSGGQFYFNELDPDHPAILFARSVNPNFDEVLDNISY